MESTLRSLTIALVALVCVQQAAAINKCVSDEGDVITYSDAPCAAESQPVDVRDNTVMREAADKKRLQDAQAQSRQRAAELQRDHDSQYNHAVSVRDAADTAERALAARNAQVGTIVPRAAIATNPTAPGTGSNPNMVGSPAR
jgi:preprotein translocase subunit Sec63